MELTISQTLQSPTPLLPDNPTSQAGFRFLSLPPEIRLLIYNELLVQPNDLLRTFCPCKFCANLKCHTIGKDCLNPSLLRTNKLIYNEALPILYSKNIFSVLCYGPFRQSTGLGISRHCPGRPGIMARAGDNGSKVGLLANRHSPWAGVTKFITCPSETAMPHVRRLSLKLLWVYHTILDAFPAHWWLPVESDVLRFFPGLEQVTVQISLKEMPVLIFHMVLQRKDLTAERMQNYKSVVADLASRLHIRAKARESLRNIEAMCDAVVESHTQGEMKKCILGVKMVSWTGDYLLVAEPDSVQEITTSIYLGCC